MRTLSSDWLIILLVHGHYYFLHTGQLMLIPYSDWLIISRLASPDTQDYTDSAVVPLNSVVNSIAIDYDPVANRVYWTDLEDDSKQSIRSAGLTCPYNERNVISRAFLCQENTDQEEVEKSEGADTDQSFIPGQQTGVYRVPGASSQPG